MKRLFLIAAMLVLGGAMAWAQTNATGGSSNTGTTSNQTTATTPSSGQNTGNTATTDTGTSSTSSDQGAAASGTQTSHKGKKAGRLPQTASPLPFLGMLGFGSMAAGMMVRKLRK